MAQILYNYCNGSVLTAGALRTCVLCLLVNPALVRSNGQVFKCVMRRSTNGNAATRLQVNSTPRQSGLEAGLYDAQNQCCTQYTYK